MNTNRLQARRPSPALVLAMVALFVSLAGTAWAVQANSVRSKHIVDGQVKTPDLGGRAVTAGKLAPDAIRADGDGGLCNPFAGCKGSTRIDDRAVSSSEIASNAVGSSEIATNAVGSTELAPNSVGSSHVADGSLTGADIQTGSITGIDINESTLNLPRQNTAVNDTGIICNTQNACTEGAALSLPAGVWFVSAKIGLWQAASGGRRLLVECAIRSGSANHDVAFVDFGSVSTNPDATLSLQALLSGGGPAVALTCFDSGVGDVRGEQMKMTAIKVG